MDLTTSSFRDEQICISVAATEILEKIYFITSVPSGKKLDFKAGQYSSGTFFDGLRRWFNGESKDNMISNIESLLSFIQVSLAGLNKSELKLIMDSLPNFIHGLQNLQQTYSSYPKYFSKISLIIEKTKLIIKERK